MSLRESDTEKAKHKLEPAGQHSLSSDIKDHADTAASYLPGQQKARDALNDNAADPHPGRDTGRQGPGAILTAAKPTHEQSTSERVQQEKDKAASHAVPNGLKSDGQDARDFVTPGNDSGLLDRVGNKVSGATAAVRSAFGGNANSHAE